MDNQPPGGGVFVGLSASFRDIHQHTIYRVLLAVVLSSALILILAVNFLPSPGAGLKVGKPSPKTVKAPQSVRVIDYEKTEELRRKAASDVGTVYRFNGLAADRSRKGVEKEFNRLLSVVEDESLSKQIKQEKIRENLPPLSPADITFAAALTSDRIAVLKSSSLQLTREAMSEKIKADEIDLRRSDIDGAAAGLGFEPPANRLIAAIAAESLLPNYLPDKAATRDAVESAREKIRPVQVVKQKDEIIVREGDVVTADQIHTLKDMGLFRTLVTSDLGRLAGLILAVFALLAVSAFYLYDFYPKIFRSNRLLLLLSVILLVTIAVGKGIAPFASPYLIPAAAAAMLATILINAETGIVMAAVVSMFLSLVVGEPQYLLVSLVGSLAGVYLTAHISFRSDLTRAGLWLMMIFAALSATASLLANMTPYEVLVNAGWGVIGGFFATMITIAGTQFLEYAFNVTTDMKLLELANPAQDLLRELMMNAPGTYNHSIITGNLAESAAEKVGANPLLTRVGAYYHDIGKIRRPFFFIENQYGANPHDKTKPNLSVLIITAHVKEGVELARQHRLPKEIIDIIDQHHGTGLISYFYNRAKENGAKEDISEDEFRYPGEKPKSREAALVMLADASEAAARTIAKPSPNRIEQMIKKIVQSKLQDGQLDECDLTLGDLEIITKIYAQTLVTMYHSRIEYPACELPRQMKGGVTGGFTKQPVQRPRRVAGT